MSPYSIHPINASARLHTYPLASRKSQSSVRDGFAKTSATNASSESAIHFRTFSPPEEPRHSSSPRSTICACKHSTAHPLGFGGHVIKVLASGPRPHWTL